MKATTAGLITALLLGAAVTAPAQLTWEEDTQVNTTVSGDQLRAGVATSPVGRTLVVWEGPDVRGRWFAPDGTPLGDDFQVNTESPARSPAVASTPANEFVVAWVGEPCTSTTSCGIHGQRFSSASEPLGGEFVVASYASSSYASTTCADPQVATTPDGRFAVVWSKTTVHTYIYDTYSYGVALRPYAADGSPLSTAVGVGSGWFDPEEDPPWVSVHTPAVAFKTPSEYVAAWREHVWGYTPGEDSIMVRRLSVADGSLLGDAIRVNDESSGASALHPRVAAGDDAFSVVWSQFPCVGPDPSWCVQTRLYSADGGPLTPSFEANVTTAGTQGAPVASPAGTAFVVAWQSEASAGSDTSGTSIQQALLSWTGEVLDPEVQVNTYTVSDQESPVVSGAVAVWTSESSPGTDQSGSSILARLTPPLAGDLRGWWRGEGDATDSSGMGNHGAFVGGAGSSPGVVGSALDFDGVDDYVAIPDSDSLDVGLGDLSLAFWVKTSSLSAIIVDKRSVDPSAGYLAYLENGHPAVRLKDASGSTNFVSDTSVADDLFHFVAISVDRDSPTGGRIWVDGQLALEFDPTGRTGSLDNSAELRIGAPCEGFGSDAHLNGLLDEVRLHARALAESAAMYLYEQGRAVIFSDGFESGSTAAWSATTQ